MSHPSNDVTVEQHLVTIEIAVARIRDRLSGARADPVAPAPGGASDERLMLLADRILRWRRGREKLFGAHLFADPVWDMLLDLFVQQRHGRPITISSLAIAAAVPATTALRYIGLMEREQLIARHPVETDSRMRRVTLTDRAHERLRTLLSEIANCGLAS